MGYVGLVSLTLAKKFKVQGRKMKNFKNINHQNRTFMKWAYKILKIITKNLLFSNNLKRFHMIVKFLLLLLELH